MRLADFIIRRGHLSEDAITRALLDGDRPAHLDQCDICAYRARELGRWLDDLRTSAIDATDEVFPAERLAAQQAQILRRITQLDEPARVIAFPNAPSKPKQDVPTRRVAPAWVGVAAAAGLVVGVVGGQIAARLERPGTAPRATEATATSAPAAQPISRPETFVTPPSLFELELERITPRELQGIDDATPRLVQTSYTIAQR